MTKETLRERLKEMFTGMPDECYEGLTFGELNVGNRYISIPVPGDNHGHGGFRKPYYLFEKVKPTSFLCQLPYNSLRLNDEVLSHSPDSMPVIKIE